MWENVNYVVNLTKILSNYPKIYISPTTQITNDYNLALETIKSSQTSIATFM